MESPLLGLRQRVQPRRGRAPRSTSTPPSIRSGLSAPRSWYKVAVAFKAAVLAKASAAVDRQDSIRRSEPAPGRISRRKAAKTASSPTPADARVAGRRGAPHHGRRDSARSIVASAPRPSASNLWPLLAFGALILFAFPASAAPASRARAASSPCRASGGRPAASSPCRRIAKGARSRSLRLVCRGAAQPGPVAAAGPGDLPQRAAPAMRAFGDDADTWWQISPGRSARGAGLHRLRPSAASASRGPAWTARSLDRISERNWKPGMGRAEVLALERPAAVRCHDRLTRSGIDLSAYTTRRGRGRCRRHRRRAEL